MTKESALPTPPEGIPWLAWAVVVVVLALVAQVPVFVQLRRTKRDVGEVKEQVKNTHEANLREDIDEAKTSAADAHTEAQLSKESSHRTERLAQDLLKTLRAVEHAIDRRDKLHADAMDELRGDQDKTASALDRHLSEIPQILDDAFARHITDCPGCKLH